MLLLALLMLAHSWYPVACCSEGHCAPVPGGQVSIDGEGYRVIYKDPTQTYYVPKSMIKASPDGQYHLCVVNGLVKCFFRPEGEV